MPGGPAHAAKCRRFPGINEEISGGRHLGPVPVFKELFANLPYFKFIAGFPQCGLLEKIK
jgi:hypothetical protein